MLIQICIELLVVLLAFYYPTILISGDNKSGTNPMDAISIKFLMDINDKLSK